MIYSKSYAIIGRGIAGLSTAYYLAREGIRPTIYGKRSEGSQASRAAQGVLCNKGLIFYESPLFRAKIESLRSMQLFLDELEKVSGENLPRFFEGVSEPFWSREDFNSTVSRIYRNKFWGCHRTHIQEPALASSYSSQSPLGYLHYPADGWFDPRALLDVLERYLLRLGLEFIDEEVKSFEDEHEGIRIDGSRIYDHVILANGAGIEDLWAQLDVKPLRMFLIGGQTLECEFQRGDLPRIQVKGNQSLALLGEQAILGSTSWLGFKSEDREGDAEDLRAAVERNFGIKMLGGQSRQGTRIRYKDRMPIVGWLNSGKFAGKIYLLSGFYKNGMHLAEICAREMLCDIVGKSDERRYPEFSALRFSV